MKIKRKSFWVVILFLLAMVFSACGKKGQDTDLKPTTSPTASVESEVTKEPTVSEEAEQVTDPAERKELRIVSFSPSITELIYALDASEYLVGRTVYCDYPEAALTVESIGDFYTPDIEKIITLEPDLIIASSLWTDGVAQKFEEAGIEILLLEDISRVDDVFTIIASLGKYLDREDEATLLIEELSSDLNEVSKKVKGYEPVSVYYVVGFGEYGDMTATGDTYISEMLAMAGGDNIAKDATGWIYSLETLVEKDPEVIIIGQNLLEEFINSPNYQNLSAVKHGNVYGIDSNLVDRQTNRIAKGISVMAHILHPEAFEE